jgi:hypothetical protein
MQRRNRRPLRTESLEPRHLLSGWHNLSNPSDVNADNVVSSLDALVVINTLGRHQSTSVVLGESRPEGEGMMDVNDDGLVTPSDALRIINTLARDPVRLPASAATTYTATISDKDNAPGGLLQATEVATLLERASAATSSNDAIIAVVDRSGRILGVRVEDGISDSHRRRGC